jgi:L-histidine Nalpha-methyltransferase
MTPAMAYEVLAPPKFGEVSERTNRDLVSEVWRGLLFRPRSLSPWMFYDARGSRLFEEITALPEYYLTRTERHIFGCHAHEMINVARNGGGKRLRFVELGAGTASKTGILLEEAARQQSEVLYVPADVSPEALDAARESISQRLQSVRVEPIIANYVTNPLQLEPYEGNTLALYIGSSIGNFSRQEARTILRNLRSQLKAGDALLLGTDMVKDEETLLAAYDDAEGVTAAFNLNVLCRLNRELDADFDLGAFGHRAVWNAAESRIEMHLESLREQRVRIPKAWVSVQFSAGETIHTENSYKFVKEEIRHLLADCGFQMERSWLDECGWYAVTLGRVA